MIVVTSFMASPKKKFQNSIYARYFNKQFYIDLPNSTSSAPASEFVLQEESFLWSATSTNLAELANVTCSETLNFQVPKRKRNKLATNKEIWFSIRLQKPLYCLFGENKACTSTEKWLMDTLIKNYSTVMKKEKKLKFCPLEINIRNLRWNKENSS